MYLTAIHAHRSAPAFTRRRLVLLMVAAAGLAPAGTSVAADAPELLVIVNPGADTKPLSKAQLEAIFTSTRRTWDNGKAVVPFSYPPTHELRRIFDKAVLGLDPEQVGRFWIDQRIRGSARPPRQVPDPSLVVRLVAQIPGAIGFVPAALVGKAWVKVVARVKNGNITGP